MGTIHHYDVQVTWTGKPGGDRRHEHEVTADGPPPLPATADPAFGGDRARWNPEQTLTAALSQCHMLWYLALCASAGIEVVSYVDDAHGAMEVTGAATGGHFVEVVLRPRVRIADATRAETAIRLHDDAHARCYIANSVNFPVKHEPVVTGPVPAGGDVSGGAAAGMPSAKD